MRKALFGPRLSSDTYAQRFRRALKMSGHSGTTKFPLDTHFPDLEDKMAMFQHRVQNEPIPFFAFAAGQCLNSSLYFAPIFTESTGVRAWPTLGQLWFNCKPVFYLSERNAHRLVRSQTSLDAFNPAPDGFTFHVWITLETGAIFDSTILATITAEDPALYAPGATVFGSPETALPQHAYVPLLVGQNLIERLLSESAIPVAILHQRHASGHAHHSDPGV